jgi:glycosyltransferase involved in cell wall biosynthesis
MFSAQGDDARGADAAPAARPAGVEPVSKLADARVDALRIGMVAPPWFELPPEGYGGIEVVVADLVNGLADRGNDVILVGAGRDLTRASSFHATFDTPPSELLGTPVPEVLHAARAAQFLQEHTVDLVHDHTLAGPLLAFGRPVPTLVTMHGPVTGELGEYFEALGDAIGVVAISDAQRRINPRLNWVGTVHNAIDTSTWPFADRKDDYLLWIGRTCDDKAPHLAIDAARAAGRRIVLSGKCTEPSEKEYFAREIAPRLGDDVTYFDQVGLEQKRELIAHAAAFLFPIQWDEPFGMVMIEAMVCGTPVVAFPRGAVPEVVVDGVTGIIVDSAAELPAAIDAATRLDPRDCRRHVEERFDLSVMAAGYERIYRDVVDAAPLTDKAIA